MVRWVVGWFEDGPPQVRVGLAAEAGRWTLPLPAQLRLGAASWNHPGWLGLVYDRPSTEESLGRQGLHAYARHPLLRSVSLPRGYYAPIPATDLEAYGKLVPDDFRFILKAHDVLTAPDGPKGAQGPDPRFLDPGYAASLLKPYLEILGSKAGPVLFQFPPHDLSRYGGPRAFAEALGTFLKALPKHRYAVEVRNPELVTPRYLRALESAGAVHCPTVYPRMQPLSRQDLPTADFTVIRWNLRDGLNFAAAEARYLPFDRVVDPAPELHGQIVSLVLKRLTLGHEVFVGVSNHAEGCAPRTIQTLAALISEAIASRSTGKLSTMSGSD